MWHVTAFTGAAWFFNFYDGDGSAVLHPGQPYIVGSYPSWWRINNGRCVFNVHAPYLVSVPKGEVSRIARKPFGPVQAERALMLRQEKCNCRQSKQ
jgi:hypothetical protein